ncbi:hypothetical protein QBZ16_002056 [Prototheca wickerhamii]|uniref:Uncharacterized protein n=1 Tax=Prototheca wickerhamii TaxID=3111 RepID=A0AAD9IL33_PROWI|nr:hypothetical protein QBZ16_002056 [Prototheca wickerhamii]
MPASWDLGQVAELLAVLLAAPAAPSRASLGAAQACLELAATLPPAKGRPLAEAATRHLRRVRLSAERALASARPRNPAGAAGQGLPALEQACQARDWRAALAVVRGLRGAVAGAAASCLGRALAAGFAKDGDRLNFGADLLRLAAWHSAHSGEADGVPAGFHARLLEQSAGADAADLGLALATVLRLGGASAPPPAWRGPGPVASWVAPWLAQWGVLGQPGAALAACAAEHAAELCAGLRVFLDFGGDPRAQARAIAAHLAHAPVSAPSREAASGPALSRADSAWLRDCLCALTETATGSAAEEVGCCVGDAGVLVHV